MELYKINNNNSSLKSIVVFVSGSGSNLQAIIDAIDSKTLTNLCISCVVSSNKKAGALQRIVNKSIKSKVFSKKDYGTNVLKFEEDLAQFVVDLKPDLIVLAGWMYILGKKFLESINSIKIINLHPALPGHFDGKNAIERAFKAFQEQNIHSTGVMVHYVTEEVDRGEPIITEEIVFGKLSMAQRENLDEFTKKVHEVEHKLIVNAIKIVLDL